MKFEIGTFDHDSRSVFVSFDHAGVQVGRSVNACLDGAGAYDAPATAERVAEVARGVQQKIELGVIKNADPSEDLVALQPAPPPEATQPAPQE